MSSKIRLSLCIPSRNRQFYFQKTITQLLKNPRTNVEFVFADNSDDAAIMVDFMRQYADDSRVIFLPSETYILSMVDNSERACAPARGDYVCMIGDDDYADVDVIDVLNRLEDKGQRPDVLGWSRPVYYWPDKATPAPVFVELNSYCGFIPKQILWDRAIVWKDHVVGIPHYPFSIYHNAVSKEVLARARSGGDGLLFHYPIPDIEFGLKLLLYADRFADTARPFTVAGICAASNSSSYGNLARVKESQIAFESDLGRTLHNAPYLHDFPFPTYLGNTIVIAQTHVWFRDRFGIMDTEWEMNFVKACSHSCAYWTSDADYERVVSDFRKAFSKWKNGRYLKDFLPRPRVSDPSAAIALLGPQIALNAYGPQQYARIWIEDCIGEATSPGEFFEIVKGLIPAPDQLDYMLDAETQPVLDGFRV
jgi:glycosyltransferase involved in cell wall biosynthesis